VSERRGEGQSWLLLGVCSRAAIVQEQRTQKRKQELGIYAQDNLKIKKKIAVL